MHIKAHTLTQKQARVGVFLCAFLILVFWFSGYSGIDINRRGEIADVVGTLTQCSRQREPSASTEAAATTYLFIDTTAGRAYRQTPPGWTLRFKPQFGDQQISSIQLKENGSETLSVEIDTPVKADAKEQPITVTARSGAFEASATIKVSLKGTQDLKMGSLGGTPNTSVTAGTKSSQDFVVGNAGTAPIRNCFVTKKPSDKWSIEFKPDKIDVIEPGQVREIKMEVLAPDRTIAGDYLLTITAN